MSSKPSGKADNNMTIHAGSIDKKLDATDAKIEAVKKEIENLKNSLNKVRSDSRRVTKNLRINKIVSNLAILYGI